MRCQKPEHSVFGEETSKSTGDGNRNAALGRNKIPHAWDLKASLLQGGADRGQALGKGMSCGAQKL